MGEVVVLLPDQHDVRLGQVGRQGAEGNGLPVLQSNDLARLGRGGAGRAQDGGQPQQARR